MTSVIVISQVPPPVHGSTMMTKMLLQCLADDGIETYLVDRRFSKDMAAVGRFKFRKIFAGLGLAGRVIYTTLRSRPSTVVLFATTRPASFMVDWLLSEILRALGQPVIGYLHTVGFRELAARGGILRWMVARLLKSFSALVCLSPSLTPDISEWVEQRRIHIIPNAVPEPPAEIGRSRSDGSVIFFSNLLRSKGPEDFLEAAEIILKLRPSTKFVLAGRSTDAGYDERLLQYARESHLHDAVEFVINPSTEDKWRIFGSASLLVFPSWYPQEAQPLTIIEAFSVGLPVVAYQNGAVADLVELENSGTIAPMRSTKAIAGAVCQILDDADELKAMSQRASQAFQRNFSSARFRESWVSLIEEVGTAHGSES